jgi:hypothetical protein
MPFGGFGPPELVPPDDDVEPLLVFPDEPPDDVEPPELDVLPPLLLAGRPELPPDDEVELELGSVGLVVLSRSELGTPRRSWLFVAPPQAARVRPATKNRRGFIGVPHH